MYLEQIKDILVAKDGPRISRNLEPTLYSTKSITHLNLER